MLEQSRKYPLVFSVALHPFIIGQPFRLRAFRARRPPHHGASRRAVDHHPRRDRPLLRGFAQRNRAGIARRERLRCSSALACLLVADPVAARNLGDDRAISRPTRAPLRVERRTFAPVARLRRRHRRSWAESRCSALHRLMPGVPLVDLDIGDDAGRGRPDPAPVPFVDLAEGAGDDQRVAGGSGGLRVGVDRVVTELPQPLGERVGDDRTPTARPTDRRARCRSGTPGCAAVEREAKAGVDDDPASAGHAKSRTTIKLRRARAFGRESALATGQHQQCGNQRNGAAAPAASAPINRIADRALVVAVNRDRDLAVGKGQNLGQDHRGDAASPGRASNRC